MTTRVLIVNYGPDSVRVTGVAAIDGAATEHVQREGFESFIVRPQDTPLLAYVHFGKALVVEEIKPVITVTAPDGIVPVTGSLIK